MKERKKGEGHIHGQSYERFHEKHYQFEMDEVLSHEPVKEYVAKIFEALGMDPENALLVSDTLVVSDLRGVYSHGIMRVPMYANRIWAGGTNPKTKVDIVKEKGAFTLMDGNNSMGQPVDVIATKYAIEKAKVFGSATVSIRGSNHNGAEAYYTMMAARENMVGFIASVAGGNVLAPWGGTDARLGHSPFSYAIPAGRYDDIVFDAALSVVANGKVMLARSHGIPIPDTWALDGRGRPTTDAEEVYQRGTLLPIATYKGYGISLGLELIASALPGASFGATQGDFYRQPGVEQNLGQYIHVIDVSVVDEVDAFKKRIDDGIDFLKASPLAEGATEIYFPGEPEWIHYHRQLKEGISYSPVTLREVGKVAKKVGVKPLY